MEDYEKPLEEEDKILEDEDDFESINEASLAEDEFIEEETDVEDIANSNKALLNALIHTLVEKGIIDEEKLLEKASSDDTPDYSVEDEESNELEDLEDDQL